MKETVDWPGKIQKEMDHAASMLELAKSRMTMKLDQDVEEFNQNTRQVIQLVKNLRKEASLIQPKVVDLKTRCHELRELLNAAVQEAEVINLQQQRLEVAQTDLKGPVYEAALELDPFQRLWDTVADYQNQYGCGAVSTHRSSYRRSRMYARTMCLPVQVPHMVPLPAQGKQPGPGRQGRGHDPRRDGVAREGAPGRVRTRGSDCAQGTSRATAAEARFVGAYRVSHHACHVARSRRKSRSS